MVYSVQSYQLCGTLVLFHGIVIIPVFNLYKSSNRFFIMADATSMGTFRPVRVPLWVHLIPIIYLFACVSQVWNTPTIFPHKEFDAKKDAQTICDIARNEKGYIPDNDKISRMVCHRTREQRFKLKEEFEQIKDNVFCSGKSIASYVCIEGEISHCGLLEDAFKTENDIYLHDLHNEFRWYKKSDVGAIIEILLSVPPMGKAKFKEDYDKAYKKGIAFMGDGSLDDDLSMIEDDIGNIIRELAQRERQPDKPVDPELAKREADLLIAEIDKWKNHRCDLDRILMETPVPQLNATLQEFRVKHEKPLEEVIEHKMKKESKRNAYLDMVRYGYDPNLFYARRLESAMKGLGTKDATLNRIISIQCEKNLAEIAEIFQLKTCNSLIEALKKDTMLHQEQLLTCLAGEKRTQV